MQIIGIEVIVNIVNITLADGHYSLHYIKKNLTLPQYSLLCQSQARYKEGIL